MSVLGSRCSRGHVACLLGVAWLLATTAAGQGLQSELYQTSPLLMGGERDAVPVILNEYNAVGPSQVLAGGGSDTVFGTAVGNGGNWFELVVTQDHLDMRGWTLYWDEGTKVGRLHLSQNALWSNLRSGTIITFTEWDTAHGGRDTDTSFNPALGDWWFNINTMPGGVFDPTYVDYTSTNVVGDGPGNFSVGNSNWQLAIDNDPNSPVPPILPLLFEAGEGLCGFTGVGNDEVGKLEENPSAAITCASNYEGGTSSTFGHPNRWSSGTMTQDFSGLRAPGNSIALSIQTSFDLFTDTATSLPPSVTTNFDANTVYFVEVWSQTMHPTGLSMVSCDLAYEPAKFAVQGGSGFPADGVFHTFLFNNLSHHVLSSGLVDDLSGGYLPMTGNCTTNSTGVAPNWSRVAVIRMRALQSGQHYLDLRQTSSGIYIFGVCGTVVDPNLVEYRDLNEPAGDLVLDVPSAPQVRMQGQTVTVELQATSLSIAINGVQALMHYNDNNLRLQSIAAASGWMSIASQDIDGDVSFAAIRPGGVGPGPGPYTVATLTFIALDVGTPVVSFLPDFPPAFPTLENAITRASDGLSMSPHDLTDTTDGDIQITACTDNNLCTDDSFDPNLATPACVFTPVTVDDGVACTIDACNSTTGEITHTPNHAVCSNGLWCDGAEVCDTVAGCVAGTPPDCSDSVACTTDTCNEATDSCDHTPVNSVCDDGQWCNGAETCDAQLGCRAGTPPDCSDGVACTTDACNEVTDSCDHTPMNSACDDGLWCNGAETCHATLGCQAGTPPDCSDGVTCTTDTCNEDTNSCDHTPVHSRCDDGTYCNGVEVCDPVLDCRSGTPVDCSDGVSCTTDTCNEVTDSCDHMPVNSACDDGLWCNGAETCNATLGCQAGSAPDCSDAFNCTADACDEVLDACTHTPVDALCDDGNPCTTDTCSASTGCGHANVPDATPCSDGLYCNGEETCVAGVCTDNDDPCPPPLSCDEANDICYECQSDADCNNGLWCDGVETCNLTTHACVAGTPPDCSDNVACTTDTCNEATDSCDHTPVNSACDDGQWCNGAETCDAQLGCRAGTAPDCSDGVACTNDACNELTDSCDHTPMNSVCDDGQWCNGAETCSATLGCQAGPAPNCNDGIDCTTDSCNEVTDACDHAPVNALCDDGAWCNGAETCNASLGCLAGVAPNCNDGIGCTTDACNEVTDACDHTPVNAACDDGLWCNGAETCDVLLGCRAGTAPNCSDGIGCTTDACNEAADTCDHTPMNSACDDGLWCNGAETCNATLGCQAGAPPNCSDADPCTIDACEEASDTCSHTLSLNINVTVEVQALSHAVTRDVDFVLTDCEGVSTVETLPVSFSAAGVGVAAIPVDDANVDYVQIIEGHTLGRLMPVVFTGCSASVSATGPYRLLAGDFSNHQWVPQDNLVDIQDFAILAVYWNQPVNPNLGTQADANGDGMQNADDFTAIQANFARPGDPPEECALLLRDEGEPEPQIQLLVAELAMPFASRADLNRDGVIDATDIRLFAQEKGVVLTPQFQATLDRMERAGLRRR